MPDTKEAESQSGKKSLTEFKTLRSSTKASINRIKTLITSKGSSLTLGELECRMSILESYFKQVLNIQMEIEKVTGETTDGENFRADIEDVFVSTKVLIQSFIEPLKQSSVDLNASLANFTTNFANTLPHKINIPIYSGKYSEFGNFIGLFTDLIHKNTGYSDLEKFNELRNHLKGPALAAISKLEVQAANYSKALEQLKQRFDNKNLIFQEHISELFSIKKMSKGAAPQLRELIDSTNSHISAMLSIGSYEDIAQAMIIYLTVQKLDDESRGKWEERIDYSKLPSWDDCTKTLSRRCQLLEARQGQFIKSDINQSSTRNRNPKLEKSSTSLTVCQNSCFYCNKKGHVVADCFKFQKLSVENRYKQSKKLLLCIQCLKKGHMVKDCNELKCSVCLSPHHKLLHRFTTATVQNVNSGNANLRNNEYHHASGSELNQSRQNMTGANYHLSLGSFRDEDNSYCFLATAVVKIRDISGKYHLARVLLDSASQLNFVTESLVQKLRLKKEKDSTEVSGIGDISATVKYKTQVSLKSRLNNYEINFKALISSKISSIQPDRQINIVDWNVPRNIELADPAFNQPAKIDLLLGADYFYDLLSVGQIKLGEQLPVLQKTLFGWVVSGNVNAFSQKRKYCQVVSQGSSCKLDELVEKFWLLEEKGEIFSSFTDEERKCEENFVENISQTENGRLMVKLPFKCDPNSLGNSKFIAERRFHALEKRITKTPDVKSQYIQFMREYETLGHMAVVPTEQLHRVRYYSPHQPVLRPESSSTKLRVVFDCSCKTSTNLSLNDILMKGPTVQDDLFDIILRFRCYKLALSADIVKMYRQILVTPSDSYFQCILWRENPKQELLTYCLKTVTYGTTSAPFLATRALNYLAEQSQAAYPLGSRVILKDFYVDDLITGADTLEEINQIRDETTKILSAAKLELKKWYSNEKSFLSEIPIDEREKPLRINDSDIIKTLGIMWEPYNDQLHFIIPEIQNITKVTKRTVLSQMSQLFDPLGLVNPIIVKAKIFMQDLWRLKLNWDESLPTYLHNMWIIYVQQLSELSKIKIPRCVLSSYSSESLQLHGFADASTRAYGCCLYIRYITSNGISNIHLISAKSRVAPVATRTLPRLELCAAELLVTLLQKVAPNIKKKISNIYLWTDSEIVLNWLASPPSCWSVFVAHRVAKIQACSKSAEWRHVGTKCNPADIVSRGALVSELLNSNWFSGPEFLKTSEDLWPKKLTEDASKCNEERRKNLISMVVQNISSNFAEEYTYSNNFEKICNKFVIVLRIFKMFKEKLKKLKPDTIRSTLLSTHTVVELEDALMRIVWHIQQKEFAEEILCLNKDNSISPRSRIKNLSPFLDTSSFSYKLLRVGGRLQNADIPYNSKHPILLPKNNPFVKSYLTYLHIKNFHAGPQALVAICRQKFWVMNCRNMCRSVIQKCIMCSRYRPKIYQQVMGNLPARRVAATRAFLVSGVDFCGPIMASLRIRGRPAYKTYIAVFVCFSTKAVHLEVVTDLTSAAFIAALKRFVARRGKCQHLYCDNGTNFVGARNEMKELREKFLTQQNQNKISQWCENEGVQFHHIPPRAPHFGGLWESAVKSAKKHLYTMIHEAKLTYEELCTVVTEVESVLNSRPTIIK